MRNAQCQLQLLLNLFRSSWPDEKFDCKETSQGFALYYKGHKVMVFLDLIDGGKGGFKCGICSGTKNWISQYRGMIGNVEEMKQKFNEYMEAVKAEEKFPLR